MIWDIDLKAIKCSALTELMAILKYVCNIVDDRCYVSRTNFISLSSKLSTIVVVMQNCCWHHYLHPLVILRMCRTFSVASVNSALFLNKKSRVNLPKSPEVIKSFTRTKCLSFWQIRTLRATYSNSPLSSPVCFWFHVQKHSFCNQ